MNLPQEQTLELLQRWQSGDAGALEALLARDLDWINAYVHRRLGSGLRRFGDTGDYVQETVIRVMTHGPRFTVSDRDQFRGLIAKIALNVLRATHRHEFALKRQPRRRTSLPSDTVLSLDPPRQEVTRPEVAAQELEEREWLRLATLLLPPRHSEVIELVKKGLADGEIAEQLGLQTNAARMRRTRALARLARTVKLLQEGRLQQVLDQEEE